MTPNFVFGKTNSNDKIVIKKVVRTHLRMQKYVTKSFLS